MNTDFSNTRYARFVPLPLIGTKGMKKIRKAKVSVVGAGGLGSVSAVQLTALGVGKIKIFDKDIVELSNLQRQMLYRENDVGKPKVLAAKKFLMNLNPEVEVEVIQEEISEDNVSLVSNSVNFVVDALDRFKPRFAVNRECLKKDIPFLFGAISGLSGNAMTITKENTCLECLFSHVDDDSLPKTSQTGIHPSIIQIIGSLQVAEATKIMIGEKPQLINKLQFCDIGTMEFTKLDVKKNPNCFCSSIK